MLDVVVYNQVGGIPILIFHHSRFLARFHKRCSGVRGDLPRVADGFKCRQCDGTIQEVDLAEDLMVDGETYECHFRHPELPHWR